ncbi:hypothetical protein [Streptomyces ziwulingensis]|uniref:CPBP family intramembrane metalloprotease n=1 Tax=Streptomyces ziwulingensis TaxID=1045501 RepID=A0ABP9AK46_9ACTN
MRTSTPSPLPDAGSRAPLLGGPAASAGMLLVLSGGPTVTLAVLTSGTVFGGLHWSPTILHLHEYLWAAAAALQMLWLTRLLHTRLSAPHHTPGHRVAAVTGLVCVGALVLGGPVLHLTFSGPADLLVRSVLLAWLACEVCWRHGIPLSAPAEAADPFTRWHTLWEQTLLVMSYCCAGVAPVFIAVHALRWTEADRLPVMQTDQATALGVSGSIELLLALPWTIVLEGVVIGTVSMLLHAAGRPAWQIYPAIGIPEVVFHAYFGLPAVLMALYAVLCARFYLRHHRLAPLLLGHAVFDLPGALTATHSLAEKLPYMAAVGIALFAIDRWFDTHAERRLPPAV